MKQFRKADELGTGGARTLPGRYYASPEIFALEQERIFARHWLCAGREEAIQGPGDFVVRNLGHDSVVLLRDGQGVVRAFHNVCRHRGTRLCELARGTFAHTIQCPYHAWTYALDGTLVGAPSMEGLADFDKRDYSLHTVHLATWEGFLFISLSEPPAPFKATYAPVLNKFPSYNLGQLRSARTIEYDVRANWKLLFENYSECYHCPTVHPDLVKLTPADSGENDLTSGLFLGGFMTLRRSGGSMTRSGHACSLPVGDLSPDDRQRVYYYAIFPNMLLSLHRDYVMVHRLWPLSHERTLIECEWLFHPAASSHPGYNPDDGVEFWDLTNRQDWHVCELSQLGVASRAYVPGPYSPRDGMSAAFDREYLTAMNGE